MRRWTSAVALGALVAMVLAWFARDFGFAAEPPVWIIMVIFLAAEALVLTVAYGWALPKAAFESRIVIKRTDELEQRFGRWAHAAPFDMVGVLIFLFFAAQTILRREEIADSLMVVVCVLALHLPTAFMTLLGIGYPKAFASILNGEVYVEYRRRAIRTGFVTFSIGCLLAFGLGLVEPEWAVLALPFVITCGIGAASTHFAILDVRDDLDD